MKRRHFTTSIASLAGLSALFGKSAFATLKLTPRNGINDQSMARQRFEACLGQQFTTRCDLFSTRLHLHSVKSSVHGHEQEQFHVLFAAPAGQELPEGNYLLQGRGKTEFWLHLLPGETIAGRQQVIATFNLQTAA
jgi:hypothetical protein